MSAEDERTERQAGYLANRLVKNRRLLRRWSAGNGISCYRLYDRDIPEIPLAIDLYTCEDGIASLVLSLYERPYEKDDREEAAWLDAMAEGSGRILGIDPARIFVRTRRRMKGLSQYERSEGAKDSAIVLEGGLRFRVNFTEYLDTGLFLDHRPARAFTGQTSSGKRVLNLFGYTGAFSVHAAAGSARHVTTVDLSNTYLGWARENFALNGIAANLHEEIRADVMAWTAHAAQGAWDIIIVDPPTFSNSTMAEGDFDVNRDWPELLRRCGRLLAKGGYILFSSNSQRLKWDGAQLSLPWIDAGEASVPPDFRNRRIHRCWLLGSPPENSLELLARCGGQA
jgi:23S rRNA (cytosine1962-C5)-methyltransferase